MSEYDKIRVTIPMDDLELASFLNQHSLSFYYGESGLWVGHEVLLAAASYF